MTDNVAGSEKKRKPRKLEPKDWKAASKALQVKGITNWVGHRDKVPLQVKNSRHAKSNDSSTWSTWEEAAAFYERTQKDPKAGAGVMLSREGRLICLDLDNAIGEDGLPKTWAQAIIERFVGKTYIERSISGRGIHVFLLGELPGVRSKATRVAGDGKVEAFSEPHFVTVSGDVYLGSDTLGECPQELLAALQETGLDEALSKPLAASPPLPTGPVDPERLTDAEEALRAINPDCPRETWLEVGMALQGAFGDAGWPLWLGWSEKGEKFVPGHCEKAWKSFTGTGIGLGTLFHHAQEAGWSAGGPRTSAAEDFADEPEGSPLEVEEFAHGDLSGWRECGLHLVTKGSGKNISLVPSEGDANIGLYLKNHPEWKDRLRYNERTMEIEVDGSGEILNLHRTATQVLWFMGWKRSPSEESVLRAATAVAKERSYDPVREKLLTLKWDGRPRLDGLLGELGLEDVPYTRRCFTRWLIGAVARAMRPGCEMQTMLVFHGEQGMKKSALLKRLAMKDAWYSESSIDMSSKDGQLMMLGPWLVEVGELSGMTRAEVEKVKLFVSEKVSRLRAPYARQVENFPRRSVLAGTTNEEEFLRDGTGARRFWLIGAPDEIRLSYLTEEVVEQVWAEAHVAYKRGERWWDEGAEVREVSERNKGHYQSVGLDALVEQVLANVKGAGVTSDAVLRTLITEHRLNPSTARKTVAQSMERAGWKRSRIRPFGKHGSQPWIYRRPDLADPAKDARVREALILAFKGSSAKADFAEEEGAGDTPGEVTPGEIDGLL